jgi:hypothetical protein
MEKYILVELKMTAFRPCDGHESKSTALDGHRAMMYAADQP